MACNGIIHRKFALLDMHMRELKAHMKGVAFARFKGDWMLRCMAERALQVMCEIVIDVAERVIAVKKAGPASSAAETIEALVSLGVLQSAKPYTDMVRFRNLIVHQYADIDPAVVYRIATKRLKDFTGFRDEIEKAT